MTIKFTEAQTIVVDLLKEICSENNMALVALSETKYNNHWTIHTASEETIYLRMETRGWAPQKRVIVITDHRYSTRTKIRRWANISSLTKEKLQNKIIEVLDEQHKKEKLRLETRKRVETLDNQFNKAVNEFNRQLKLADLVVEGTARHPKCPYIERPTQSRHEPQYVTLRMERLSFSQAIRVMSAVHDILGTSREE